MKKKLIDSNMVVSLKKLGRYLESVAEENDNLRWENEYMKQYWTYVGLSEKEEKLRHEREIMYDGRRGG